jgi:hypothetical protein
MASMAAQTLHEVVPAGNNGPAYRLYDANAVTLAAFLGTPVIGGALMAVNYQRLGQRGKAVTTLMAAVVVTALAILIGWNIPQGASFPIALALVFAMKFSARSLQGAAVRKHVEEGGKLESKGLSAALGLGFSAALFGMIFLIVTQQVKAETGPSIQIGANDEVYYAGRATKDQAQALGNALKESGYFRDEGADVFLANKADGTSLSFIVKAGSWDDPAMVGAFEVIGQQVAPLIGGFPIQIKLMDRERAVMAESTVGRAAVGNDHIYYFGTATADEAQMLGQGLKADHFFTGKGVDVFLAKHEDGTMLSFVVDDGVWNQPGIQSEFEQVVRQVAHKVGGLPVRLRMMNTRLETKKDEAVN